MPDKDLLQKNHQSPVYHFWPLKEALLVGGTIFLVTFFVSYFIYHHALNAQRGEIKEGLIRAALIVASSLDGDVHKQFVDPKQETGELYLSFIKPLQTALDQDKDIAFVYTAIMRGDKVHFIVDPTPPGDNDGDGVDDKAHIMEVYEDPPSEIVAALKQQKIQVTQAPYTDKWGSFMSAYVPFNDSQGNFVGVFGIDITADNYFTRLAPMLRATVRAMVAGFFVSFLVAALVWFMRNFGSVVHQRRNEVIGDFQTLRDQVDKKSV